MYLSKIEIENYKGIKKLSVDFHKSINIIIGENGCCKTALIDAIRLLHNLRYPRDLSIGDEDFYYDVENKSLSEKIIIVYEFRDLNDKQEGALCEYMILDKETGDSYARIEINSEKREGNSPSFCYFTGKNQHKADSDTLDLFKHYYLDALRDSTKDLLKFRGNILGRLIINIIKKNKTETEFEKIVSDTNDSLLAKDEVKRAKIGINTQLNKILGDYNEIPVDLNINPYKIEYIINAIKPYIPIGDNEKDGVGFSIIQNSLGFNNLIYIATVLGDIDETMKDDDVSHFALLIEEPEAHLHPQLQLSLYDFLKNSNKSKNSQLFLTTHSPTLASKSPLENLILLDKKAYRLGCCFDEREYNDKAIDSEEYAEFIEWSKNEKFNNRRKQLERYLDVSRSQLFFSKAIFLVEGVSEELLFPILSKLCNFDLTKSRIELVNVCGVSFYPFLYLFNSSDDNFCISKPVVVFTDNDRCPESNKYSSSKLIKDDFKNLNNCYEKMINSSIPKRINHIKYFSETKNGNINLQISNKTFEFDFILTNISNKKENILNNFLISYLADTYSVQFKKIQLFMDSLRDDIDEEYRYKLAILLWKIVSTKSTFAQEFSLHIEGNFEEAKKNLLIPEYLKQGVNFAKEKLL